MSRRELRRKKRLQRESQRRTGKTKIDERYAFGPLEFMRAGKMIIMKNSSTPEQQAEIRKKAAEANARLIVELEIKIKELQQKVRKHDPLELMDRAGYQAMGLLIHGKTESELSGNESKILPSIEYLQYLIARTTPDLDSKDISKKDWEDIWSGISEILDTASNYLMTSTPRNEEPSELEGLANQVNWMRLMVRVKGYPNFLEDYWKASFEPYGNLLKRTYGVDAVEVVESLKDLAQHQRQGPLQKHLKTRIAVEKIRKKAQELGINEGDREAYKAAIEQSSELAKLHQDAQEKAEDAYTVKAFEITEASSLPKSILSLLSIKPGEQPLGTLTGPNHEDLSPLSTDVLHYKPFVEVDGKFYAFYHTGFEDRMTEIIEADLNMKYPEKRSSVEKDRSDYVEKLSLNLLSGMMGASYAGSNLYYPNPDDGQLTELDGLLEADDVLLLIEVKSGGISAGASRGALKSLEGDLKDLIFEGQRQSERAEHYIKSADKIGFFDKTGKNILHTVQHKKFRKIFRIVVTREQLGWVGASLAKLSVLDSSLDQNLPWQVSLDDLRPIAELFDNKGIEFSHYLEVRLEAANNKILSQHDEIDHIALYNSMNYYHKNVDDRADMMTFNAYGLEIDRYFMDKAAGGSPQKPEQKMSRELRELIAALNNSDQPHRFEIGSFLLGYDIHQRKEATRHLKKVFDKQRQGSQRTIRFTSLDLKLGVSIGSVEEVKWENERLRCAVFMKKHSIPRWLSVHIDTSEGLRIAKIVELYARDFTDEGIESAKMILERDIELSLNNTKIARNHPCPCGSGERFKNCHDKAK